MCHTCAIPAKNRYPSAAEARAIPPSAMIITLRLLKRSISGPANGPISTCGMIATSVAVARTVADPVVVVNHHTRANCTS